MDISYSVGGLIPLWILGVPLLSALISLATTPKAVYSRSDLRDTPGLPTHPPAAGFGAVRM
jgi:hypothetical protein